jgi:hypothetical protein
MENIDQHQDAPMNEFDPQDKERMENWKALQVALGLVPDEMPVPMQQVKESPPPNPPTPAKLTRSESIYEEITEPEPMREREESAPVDLNSPAPARDASDPEQEVEVGEAPEEVPEEPADEQTAPGEKRRRRRRRRRRRGAGEAADDGAGKSDSPLEGAEGAAGPTEAAEAGDEEDDGGEDDLTDDDEEEIEPLSIPDWNVPTWQELIASLYRPER